MNKSEPVLFGGLLGIHYRKTWKQEIPTVKENGEKELLLIFNMNMDAHSFGVLKV